jgi:hypothetical protein
LGPGYKYNCLTASQTYHQVLEKLPRSDLQYLPRAANMAVGDLVCRLFCRVRHSVSSYLRVFSKLLKRKYLNKSMLWISKFSSELAESMASLTVVENYEVER